VRTALRLVSVIGALGAGSLTLTACDASPYAARVGGQVVSVNALNHELAQFSADQAFVRDFDANQAAQAQQSGAGPVTIVGAGGPGTYSSQFVSQVLGVNIEIDAVHQDLAATGQPATPDEAIAARAAQEATGSAFWDQFPLAIRNLLVEQLADEGALTPVPADPTSLQGAYSQIQPYLFSSLCMEEASAFSSAAAQSIVASGNVTGTKVCLSQTDMEQEPAAFQAAARGLTVGQVSQPIPTSYGFQVLQLVSRSSPGLDPGVERVLAADSGSGPSLQGILTKAHVKVNPRYGTWSGGQVTPPQAPLS
jgi:hypothetical protein